MRFGMTGAVATALLLAGCAEQFGSAPPPVVMSRAPDQAFDVPWQLTPASTASEGAGERTQVSDVPGYGRVKGTPSALAQLATAPTAYPGPAIAVDPCRAAVQAQVAPVGATNVEAAAAGPERRLGNGAIRQQVFFRIMYSRGPVPEVRQSALVCTVRHGRVLNAVPA